MKILIAGGGTGGHIYPALSIAQALKEEDQKIVIEFVGTPTGLESKLIPRAGHKIHYIPVGRLNQNVSFFERLKTIINLPYALWLSFRLLKKIKPDLVLGVGGYASGPLVFMGSLLGFNSAIWEPNAYPGLANRWLSRFVDHSYVVFPEAGQHLKSDQLTVVPMPVRQEIENVAIDAVAPAKKSKGEKFHVLLFGGSQGARPLNNILSEAVTKDSKWLSGIEIVHQSGPLDYLRIKLLYESRHEVLQSVKLHEYLHDMPSRYQWADLVIARSGTGTLSELAACGKAAILIPLPSAADDHQTKNALALTDQQAAVFIPQKELTADRLIKEILQFKDRPDKIRSLSSNIRKFYQAKGAQRMAQLLIELVKSARKGDL